MVIARVSVEKLSGENYQSSKSALKKQLLLCFWKDGQEWTSFGRMQCGKKLSLWARRLSLAMCLHCTDGHRNWEKFSTDLQDSIQETKSPLLLIFLPHKSNLQWLQWLWPNYSGAKGVNRNTVIFLSLANLAESYGNLVNTTAAICNKSTSKGFWNISQRRNKTIYSPFTRKR